MGIAGFVRALVLAAICLQVALPAVADDGKARPPAGLSFTDVSAAAGIGGAAAAGGHGAAFADVDGDGDLDIYVTNTPGTGIHAPNYLYINLGNGRFSEQAAARGVDGTDLGSHGALFADLDNDGDLDLIVANSGLAAGPGQDRVYINDGGGYFSDGTRRARLKGKLYRTRGVAAGDFNGDGYVDFVLTNPVADTNTPPGQPLAIKRFFRNKGKKARFARTSAGLLYTGFAQAITAADVDGDGDIDLVESKWPHLNYDGRSNSLWLNDGSGSFSEAGSGLGDSFFRDGSNRYNGSALGDTDNDGDLDLLILGDGLRFFRNDGGGAFNEISESSGLQGQGFSAAFGDLNNDGRLDVVVADNTHAATFVVFRNLGANRFEALSGIGALPPSFNDPRGMALGDYDGDGDLDIVVVHKKAPVQLFRNNRDSKAFIKLRLTSPQGQRGAIGTRVWVYRAGRLDDTGGLLAYREVGSSTAYISQNAPEVHVGLWKNMRRVDIRIRFPGGATVTLLGAKRGKVIEVDPKALATAGGGRMQALSSPAYR